MKVGVIAFSKRGNKLATTIHDCWEDVEIWSKYEDIKQGIQTYNDLHHCVKYAFQHKELLIFVGATGIAVRLIAPYLVTKSKDPAVIVVDETGQFIISLLSGHLGGANAYTDYLAKKIGGTSVITTATDGHHLWAPDLLAKENKLVIKDIQQLKKATALLLEQSYLFIYDEENRVEDLPQEYRKMIPGENRHNNNLELVVHWKKQIYSQQNDVQQSCYLIPRVVCLGIGCKRGKSKQEIQEVVDKVLFEAGIFKEAISTIGTIDLKANEEGLIAFAYDLGIALECYTSTELNGVQGNFHPSEFVTKITGVDNVCERAAVRASKGGELVISRVAQNGVTVAVAVIKGALK